MDKNYRGDISIDNIANPQNAPRYYDPNDLTPKKANYMVLSFKANNCRKCQFVIAENIANPDKGCCKHPKPDPDMWHNYCYTRKVGPAVEFPIQELNDNAKSFIL